MTVIPAQAGIQTGVISADVGPRLRGDDGNDTVNNHANRSNPRWFGSCGLVKMGKGGEGE